MRFVRCGPAARMLVLALSVTTFGTAVAGVQSDAHAVRGEQAAGASAVKALEVVVDGNRVSVRAEGAPLGKILLAIASRTGMVVHLRGDTASRPIHLQFANLRLDVALRRLLAGTSYSLVYSQPGNPARVKTVYVLANLAHPAAPPAAVPPAAVDAHAPTRLPAALREALAEAQRNQAQANANPGKIKARQARLVELLREALKGDPSKSIAERLRTRLRDAQGSIP